MDNQSSGTISITVEADYSVYSLGKLFKERHWTDAHSDPALSRSLEAEIQKRCAHIRARTNHAPSAAAGSSRRFRPYGFILGVAFLFLSVGPFAAVEFLDTINFIGDASGDKGSLSGMWALLTLPVAVPVFMIGGMWDAERVVKWLNLVGRQQLK